MKRAAIVPLLLTAGVARGAATAPLATPTTRPARLQTPAGCVRLEVRGRVLMTDPADVDWVRQAAERAPPGIPTTQPIDLLNRFRAHRAELAQTMLADLPTLQPNDVADYLDGELAPELETLARVRAYPIFLVLTDKRLTEIVRQGWTEPHFHYNRQADHVDIERGVTIQVRQPVESAVAALYDPALSQEQRTIRLADAVGHTELLVNQSITARSTVSVMRSVGRFLSRKVLANLPQTPDQLWFSTGLTNVLAGRYAAMIHGAPLAQFIAEMIRPPGPGPIDESAVNLLYPFSPDDLKPELVGPYGQACQRKSIAVMFLWMNRAGVQAVAPLLASIRKFSPADGPTLVKMIEASSHIDLTPILTGRLKPI